MQRRLHAWGLIFSLIFFFLLVAHGIVVWQTTGKHKRYYRQLANSPVSTEKPDPLPRDEPQHLVGMTGSLGRMFTGIVPEVSPVPRQTEDKPARASKFIAKGIINGPRKTATLALRENPEETYNVSIGQVVEGEKILEITHEGVRIELEDKSKVFLVLQE